MCLIVGNEEYWRADRKLHELVLGTSQWSDATNPCRGFGRRDRPPHGLELSDQREMRPGGRFRNKPPVPIGPKDIYNDDLPTEMASNTSEKYSNDTYGPQTAPHYDARISNMHISCLGSWPVAI